MNTSPTTIALTEAWYTWERRGRGWDSNPFPVALEPPFAFFVPPKPAVPVDDARRHTWVSHFLEGLAGRSTAIPEAEALFDGSPEAPPAPSDSSDMVELQVLIPEKAAVSRSLSAAMLRATAPRRGPLAWELVGTGGKAWVQIAVDSADRALMHGAVTGYLPEALLVEPEHSLLEVWGSVDGSCGIVEFGLGREFVVPLAIPRDGVDPLAPLISTLGALASDEVGVVQVVCEELRAPWAEAISRAVVTYSGKPFFADAPEITRLAQEKIASPLYAVLVRIAVASPSGDRTWEILRSLAGGLVQFGQPGRNELVPLSADDVNLEVDLLLRRAHRPGMILSLDELTGLLHLPEPSLRVPSLLRSRAKSAAAPPVVLRDAGLALGINEHAGTRSAVFLSDDARMRHVHLIGASGTGKSTLLFSMIAQDIERGAGVGVIDPHGDLADAILAVVPTNRLDDVVIIDPSDDECVTGWNLLQARSEVEHDLLADDLVAVFRRQATSWGDQMTAVLANAILALLASRRPYTLADLRQFLLDDRFRQRVLAEAGDPQMVLFWRHEFPLLVGKRPQTPILTRLDRFLRSKRVRETVTAVPGLNLRDVVDSGMILLVKLAQGTIGVENASLLGSLLVSSLHQVTLARQELREEDRRPFFLYIDEFQDVATESMASLVSGVRKFRLSLTLAHQSLSQLHRTAPDLEQAVLANAHTRICFRVGDDDARYLERGFSHFTADDLAELSTGHAICRVGGRADDFNLTVRPRDRAESGEADRRRSAVRERSRLNYGTPRHQEAPVAAPVELSPQVFEARREPEAGSKQEGRGAGSVVAREAVDSPPKIERAGKGGPQHTYLQELISRWGQDHGFKATVEHELANGGRIDVLLERGDGSFACEIAVTTSLGHELQNIKKCLTNQSGKVAVVSLRKSLLAGLQRSLKEDLDEESQARVLLLSPEELLALLAEEPAGEQEKTVAGYRVKVRYNTGGNEAQSKAVAEVVARGLAKMRRAR